MVRTQRRRMLAILCVALLAPFFALGTSTAGALVEPENGQCFDGSFQLSFEHLPPAKRVILRAGGATSDRWVATLDGNPEVYAKTRGAHPEDARWLAIIVPADGSPLYTIPCLPSGSVYVLGYNGVGCYGRSTGAAVSPDVIFTFVGLGEARAQLRSVESGWIADITGAVDARVSRGAMQVRWAERKVNEKYDPNDSFYVRVRKAGKIVDTPCDRFFGDVDRVLLQEVPGSARPVPDNVGVDQPNFFVRSVGEEIVEIVDKTTGDVTSLRISDDFTDPRIEPSGRVLWLRDREEGEQLRANLDTMIVTRIARA